VFICLALLAAILYTYLYIRRIKRQQRETLEKYLAMIEARGEKEEVRSQKEEGRCEKEETKDPVLERVMSYLEEHLSDSDIGVGDMAAAAATSRSGLQRKLKQTMGITPQDLLREARIKRACQLLRTSNKTVAEVAYACGFSDPKYFSRSFKQSTGQSPTEFKNASI
jgi:AraC-like DNA-binding protein